MIQFYKSAGCSNMYSIKKNLQLKNTTYAKNSGPPVCLGCINTLLHPVKIGTFNQMLEKSYYYTYRTILNKSSWEDYYKKISDPFLRGLIF